MLLKLLSRAFSARTKAREAPELEALYVRADLLLRANRNSEALSVLREALRSEFAPAASDDAELLRALLELLWSAPPARWAGRMTPFEQYGWLLGLNSQVLPIAVQDIGSVAADHAERAAEATLRLLDFRRGAAPARIEALMSDLVLPWMRRAAESGDYSLALMLEKKAYTVYVIANESERNFSEAFAMWSGFMRAAGKSAARSLPPVRGSAGEPPRVAFYLHTGNLMAHTRVLLDFLEALPELQPAPLVPFVFHRGPATPELAGRAAAMGLACRSLDPAAGGMGSDYEALLLLRRLLAEERIDALVWVSLALHMGFAFSMRTAPVQIWWALKYHGLEYPEIDGYLTSGSAGSTKRVGAKLWRSAPLAAQDWCDPGRSEEARTIRSRYAQHEVLLACVGREEKLNSEPFLAAVAAVLHACPQAGFLWTGRERLFAIQARLNDLGVGNRCHYIGWVDTKLYAQVLDVFVDSFPFPCAFTLYEAMGAGKPVVTYASAESVETGLAGLLGPLLAGESGTAQEQERARAIFDGGLYFCAKTQQDYVEMAIRLAREAQLRHAVGEANRRFVVEFLSDRARTARILATHLVELIGEARQRS